MVRKVCVNYSKIRGRLKNVLLFIQFQIPSFKTQFQKSKTKVDFICYGNSYFQYG